MPGDSRLPPASLQCCGETVYPQPEGLSSGPFTSLQSTTLTHVSSDLSSAIYFSKNTHPSHFMLVAFVIVLSLPLPVPTPLKSYASKSYSARHSWFVKAAVQGTKTAMGTLM